MSVGVAPSDSSGILGAADAAQRQPLGIPALDTLLGGGLPYGNSVLVQGAPGAGKTVLGMQFLHAGATLLGEPGMFVTFEEHPRRLYRDAHSLGWNFDQLEREQKILIVFTSPAVFLQELESDHYSRLVARLGVRRIVVDSLAQFETIPTAADDLRIRFQRIVNALRREKLMIMMTRELKTRDEPHIVTPEEYLADTIIQMEYPRIGERRERRLEVLKHRGSVHSPTAHRFVISEGGLQILHGEA